MLPKLICEKESWSGKKVKDESSTLCGQNKVYALKLSEGYRIVNTYEDDRIANRLICRVKTFCFTKLLESLWLSCSEKNIHGGGGGGSVSKRFFAKKLSDPNILFYIFFRVWRWFNPVDVASLVLVENDDIKV